MLDATCGDHHWTNEMNIDVVDYTGVDIVKELLKLITSKCNIYETICPFGYL